MINLVRNLYLSKKWIVLMRNQVKNIFRFICLIDEIKKI